MYASHRAVRGLIVELTNFGKHTITDMEAGLEHLKRGTAKNVEMMLIVVEPYYRSLEAGMRTYRLAKELGITHLFAVSNKTRNLADKNAIESFCEKHSMEIIGDIPVKTITKEGVISYTNIQKKLPINRKKNPKYRDLTLEEILKLKNVTPQSRLNVNKYLTRISTLMNWGKSRGYIAVSYTHLTLPTSDLV